MEENVLKELTEVIQSSNINFLFGAGVSIPFLPSLGNIESKLNGAKSEREKEIQYKEYFKNVMLPNINVLDDDFNTPDYISTKKNYDAFFTAMTDILLQRKSTILSKQINIFTTNIDVLIEKTLERLLIDYNDGFTGKFHPVFSPANFKKSIKQRSLHFDHISEIPVYNIIKLHGSLTWKKVDSKIIFSHNLDHINNNLDKLTGSKFKNSYKNILVVNPEESKHLESVLNLYYSELLRLYSSELEKENSTLFILGFSMEDKHIKEITLRAAKANPTLRIFVCCSQKSKTIMESKYEIKQHRNIEILSPGSNSEKFTLNYFADNITSKVIDYNDLKDDDNGK